MDRLLLRNYRSIRNTISSGDMLLYRYGGGLFSRGIAAAGRSIYSHVAMAAWWDDRLFALETRAWIGGTATLLSNYVENYPDRVDVYKAGITDRQREVAVDWMKSATGKKYGWGTTLSHAARLSPILSMFLSAPLADDRHKRLPVCSELVSRAYREAGADPIPNLSDKATLPGDLARSTMFEYKFTLSSLRDCA